MRQAQDPRHPGNPRLKDDWLELGLVGKVRGLSGAFMFRPHNPQTDAFQTLKRVRIDDKIYDLEAVQQLPSAIALTLVGISTPERARALVGKPLFGLRTELPRPQDGELYLEELTGRRVVDDDGLELGVVIGFSHGGDEMFFDVRTAAGTTIAVPASGPFIVRLDGDAVVLRGVSELFTA